MRVLLLLLFLGQSSFALEFKGYKKDVKLPAEEFKAKIQQIRETETDFYLLFEGRAAFYAFPKRAVDSTQAKNFLEGLKLSQKEILVEINPLNAQVLRLKE